MNTSSRSSPAPREEGRRVLHAECVVRVLVEMLAPYKGRVYDPCCGSGGMFVSREKFVEAHGGRLGDISIFGQESNPTTWRLAQMNLAIRGIEANLGPEHADTFHRDLHPDLRADYVLANPPFNDSDWCGNGRRCPLAVRHSTRRQRQLRLGAALPPSPRPQRHSRLRPCQWRMSSNQSGEGEIRQAIVEADLVDCMVALPGQLFYTTPDSGLPLVSGQGKKEGNAFGTGAIGPVH